MDLGAFVRFAVGNTDLNVEDMYWHGRRWSGGFQKISQPRKISSATKDKIMKLSSTTSMFAYLIVIVVSGDPSQHLQDGLLHFDIQEGHGTRLRRTLCYSIRLFDDESEIILVNADASLVLQLEKTCNTDST
ncbi:hypothetical protein MTR67_053171 [Solanum verrucosum]|uniref:Uncharacterized protein n=1 Tax=Solanum verrucosum TaxID=315347 RepID=A0AAF0VAF4_SOLVR|nr:hypothetical protein MTR67_053171 [Solanum verrucosum]